MITRVYHQALKSQPTYDQPRNYETKDPCTLSIAPRQKFRPPGPLGSDVGPYHLRLRACGQGCGGVLGGSWGGSEGGSEGLGPDALEWGDACGGFSSTASTRALRLFCIQLYSQYPGCAESAPLSGFRVPGSWAGFWGCLGSLGWIFSADAPSVLYGACDPDVGRRRAARRSSHKPRVDTDCC